ncbi:hypothetical protein J2X36_004328 [Methylobacterium sp. BE186]|uniref:hypothetical protein n=1 Tax=Methylobacterium sp. BE186 TaxID=2817715 RepID=UPI00285DCF4A|nr:hypothetical protein [Methylobacterium sp. BE186]MDR7039552.1 hypothetical protein [Methylobacterium sp. BE186]
MYSARSREVAEPWLVLPEPALDRYLLRSRRRAANDNSRLPYRIPRTVLFGACAALISVLSLAASQIW